MNEITRNCPDCDYRNTFIEVKGYTFSPIVCKKCHALLEITYEDDWEFVVIGRVELRTEYENSN